MSANAHPEYSRRAHIFLSFLYAVGLLGTFFDLGEVILSFIRRLPLIVRLLITYPFYAVFMLFLPFAGSIAFNCWGGSFRRIRLTLSSLALAVLYLLGNSLHFNASQWYWLHPYMCGQLLCLGYVVPTTKPTNWIAFGLLVAAFYFHAKVAGWQVLDCIWGSYFVILGLAPWFLKLRPLDMPE